MFFTYIIYFIVSCYSFCLHAVFCIIYCLFHSKFKNSRVHSHTPMKTQLCFLELDNFFLKYLRQVL